MPEAGGSGEDLRRLWWLASYPKSGNTWMRVLLSNYVDGADRPADINRLSARTTAGARDAFDDHAGLETSDLTQEEIDRFRPLVYLDMARRATGPVFVKVHDAYGSNGASRPLFPAEATGGVLYLVRNPLDVAVSFAHHASLSLDRTIAVMADPTFAFMGNSDRMFRQIRQRVSTWSGHVRSWLDQSTLPVEVVRYEDLHADPPGVFRRALRFLGFEPDEERVRRAVEFSSFANLQAQEASQGFIERMPGAARFFREGRVGTWRRELGPTHVERLLEAHRDVMARLGYLDGDRPVF